MSTYPAYDIEAHFDQFSVGHDEWDKWLKDVLEEDSFVVFGVRKVAVPDSEGDAVITGAFAATENATCRIAPDERRVQCGIYWARRTILIYDGKIAPPGA